MAKNQSIQQYNPRPVFEDNKPVNLDTKTPVDAAGQEVSPIQRYDIQGEVVELQKRHYGNTDASQILDRSFSELTKTKDSVTPETFFNLYRELFYDIPKIGEDSHVSLMLESKNYLNDYIDPKDEKIDELIERIVDIEAEKAEIPTEHPLFPNGTAVRVGQGPGLPMGALGIMQEGRVRKCSNQGTPSPFTQLKKPLGFVDNDGKLLKDSDCFTFVSQQTFDTLPKWPDFHGTSAINENTDWGATLQDFIPPTSNLTELNSKIISSELNREEIRSLIRILEKKAPFEGYTIEDNYEKDTDGNFIIQYESGELLPFNGRGNIQGQIKVYNIVRGIEETINGRLSQEIFELSNNIRTFVLQFANPNQMTTYAINSGMEIATNIRNSLRGYDQEEYDEGLELISTGLQTKLSNLKDERKYTYRRYIWTTDPDKLETGNAKFYWVENASSQYHVFVEKRIDKAIKMLGDLDFLKLEDEFII